MQLIKDIISTNSLYACILVVATLCTESHLEQKKGILDYKDSTFSVDELLTEINTTPIISEESSIKQCESMDRTWNHYELNNYSMWCGPKSSSTICRFVSCSSIVQF